MGEVEVLRYARVIAISVVLLLILLVVLSLFSQ